MLSLNHTFDISDIKVLQFQKRGFKLNLLESLEIKKAIKQKKNLMNEQLDLYQSPLVKPM